MKVKQPVGVGRRRRESIPGSVTHEARGDRALGDELAIDALRVIGVARTAAYAVAAAGRRRRGRGAWARGRWLREGVGREGKQEDCEKLHRGGVGGGGIERGFGRGRFLGNNRNRWI